MFLCLCLCLCFSNQHLPNNFNKNHFKTLLFVILLHFMNLKLPKKETISHEKLFLNNGFFTGHFLVCCRKNHHVTEIKGLINTVLWLAEILQCCRNFKVLQTIHQRHRKTLSYPSHLDLWKGHTMDYLSCLHSTSPQILHHIRTEALYNIHLYKAFQCFLPLWGVISS